eukprot:ANDGO_03118.mRNA.1 Proteasome subunit beta type-1
MRSSVMNAKLFEQQGGSTGGFHNSSTSLSSHAGPSSREFSPYTMNNGSVLAIAGVDFVVVAGDTRLSEGFNIHTRSATKLRSLSSSVAIASAGMQADCASLHKLLDTRVSMYAHANGNTPPSASAVAQMLSIILYQRRFFPFYAWNLVCGILPDGSGAVYAYDPVGNFERVPVSVSGSAEPLIQPLLDNQIEAQPGVLEPVCVTSSLESVVDLVKDAFTSAGERDIYTGDGVDIYIMTKEGTRREFLRLKED